MVSAVPQIEGLTVEDILEFARGKASILKHLPDERDWVHIDRKWVCDVVYTLDKNAFQTMITDAMKKRKDRLEESQNLIVQMRPEFAQALNSCLNFSSKPYTFFHFIASHGRAANLVKGSSKRKRTKEEIEEVKGEEEELKDDRHLFLKRIKKLKEEKAELESVVDQMSLH
jgi:hypothetical protein